MADSAARTRSRLSRHRLVGQADNVELTAAESLIWTCTSTSRASMPLHYAASTPKPLNVSGVDTYLLLVANEGDPFDPHFAEAEKTACFRLNAPTADVPA